MITAMWNIGHDKEILCWKKTYENLFVIKKTQIDYIYVKLLEYLVESLNLWFDREIP